MNEGMTSTTRNGDVFGKQQTSVENGCFDRGGPR